MSVAVRVESNKLSDFVYECEKQNKRIVHIVPCKFKKHTGWEYSVVEYQVIIERIPQDRVTINRHM
jgi:hypothetical protein